MTTIWPDDEPDPVDASCCGCRAAEPVAPGPLLPVPLSLSLRPNPCRSVTCCPTVRSTEATVPAMVDVSDASFEVGLRASRARTRPT